jgi:DNA-binding MarR family transcriptional regulator
MVSTTPLPVLLSQVLVALVIEFDNEFAVRLSKTWARPFGVSMVIWSNFMRFVSEEGVTVGHLVTQSCVPKEAVVSVVGGTERWGYITVDHDPADGVPPRRKGFGSGRGVKTDTVIRPSMTGKIARDLWDGLAGEIEQRWRSRLGDPKVQELRESLIAIQSQIELVMPHFLPIVGGGGLFSNAGLAEGPSEPDDDLPALLSRVLLAFTLEHEKDSDVSLPVGANVLRVLTDEGTPVKQLPLATGVSKEAVSMTMTWLSSTEHITVEPDPNARGKLVALTAKGRDAQDAYQRRLGAIETAWEERFGTAEIAALRGSLLAILDQRGGEDGPLSAGLVTPPGGWRGKGRYKALTDAFVASPRDALPHYPMVLHRGGWPDGS